MPNWKEPFSRSSLKALASMGTTEKGLILANVPFEAFSSLLAVQEQFIQTEIIEKLIRDAHKAYYKANGRDRGWSEATQQLRAKWLGAVCPKCGDPVKGDTDGLCGRCV